MNLIIVIFLGLTLQQCVRSMSSVNQCVYNPFVQYGPIDLDTSLATAVATSSPLTFTVGDNERFKIQNTGRGVEIVLDQATTLNSVSGGVLGNTVYLFHKIRFFWDNNYEGAASYTVDNIQTALSGEYIYYKKSCGSYANAYNQFGGIFIARAQLTVEGAIANPSFSAIEKLLRSITKAGSSCVINGQIRNVVYSWYDQIALNYPFYYTYQGKFYDPDQNSTSIYDATYMAIPKSRNGYLSICQFTAFTNLLNEAGSPIDTVQSAYSSEGRNIQQAVGIVEKICPTSY